MTTSPSTLLASKTLAALLALSCTGAAHAVDFSVGAGAGYAPKYEGAKKYEFSPFPVLSISGDNWFIGGKGNGPAAGLQYAITPEWKTGVFVGLHGGRKEKDGDRLFGTDEIKNHGVGGLFTEYQLGRFGIGLTYYQAFKREYGSGALLDLSYQAWESASGTTSLSVGANAHWSSKKAMNTWFGVTAAQARASGGQLTPYELKGGMRSYGVSATLSHQFAPRWTTSVTVGMQSLAGKTKDSPLVEKRNGAVGSVSIAYEF